jgi:dipeptidyl aminopeptidase/acylaminoacyl peptidase
MSRKVVFCMVSIVVLAAIILIIWYLVGRSQGTEAILYPEEGTVTVKSGFNTVSLSAPQVLEVGEGDEVETGTDSSALIVLLSGASAQLGPETDVILRRLSLPQGGLPIVELEVRRGDTWHQLPSFTGAEVEYQVLTPSATVTLSPERHHITVADDGSTRAEATHGFARVKAQSTEVDLWPGEYTSVPPGRAPAIPRSVTAWFLFVSAQKGNNDIWLLDEQGKEFQLTDSSADDLAPAWSPDGARIAFETLRDGNNEIYVMNHDGSEQVNLTQNLSPDHAPAWSPDGTRIAFESLRDGVRDIYVMTADGTDQTRLTFGPGLNVAPQWSTDGAGIVFSRIEGDTNNDGRTDLADMGNFFFVNDKDGAVQAVWHPRMIFEQLIFPWGRRLVG